MRSLEEHLSPEELTSLPESREALAAGRGDQIAVLQHLQLCRDCSALAETLWSLRMAGVQDRGMSTEGCPPETTWLEVAAGLHQVELPGLLEHAVRCRNCAPVLKEALDVMQPVQFGELATTDAVSGLRCESPEWQNRMGREMRAAAGDAANTSWRMRLGRLSRPPWWVPVFVAAPLLMGAAVLAWVLLHPSNESLLAAAYNKQRILVLRIPGGDPVPMASGTRGVLNGLSDPSPLVELRLRVQRHLERTPNSPYWHQVLGQIEILDGDGFSARRDLEIAQAVNENLPDLRSDLAAASFEIGDKTGNAESYAEAAELYSEQIRNHAANPALLHYNRALCWERQNLTQNALDDLRTALSLERSPAWRRTIEAEISRLSQRSSVTPADDYEAALMTATQSLIPQWARSPDARSRLMAIASTGLRHHDRWLLDWIDATHSATAQQADHHLAMAVADASSGQGQLALSESRQAITLYKRAGETPGRVRAQLTEIYALQRLARSSECLRLGRRLAADQNLTRYAWIRIELTIDEGNCNSFLGNFDAEQSAFEQALRLSRATGLPVLNIRAMGAKASLLTFRGTTAAAWEIDVSGLHLCERIQCSPVHRYKFLYNLVTAAQNLGLVNVAAEIMRTAEQDAAASGDRTVHEYSLETLAKLMGHAGEFSDSDQAFGEAWDLAHKELLTPMAALYQAEWQIDRADVLRREGNIAASIDLLHQSAPQILASDYQNARVNYYTELSIADRLLGENNAALADALNAVHESEKSLSTLVSPIERAQWSHEHLDSYAALVRVYLQRGDATSALNSWEKFRSAPYARSAAILRWRSPSAESEPADLAGDYVVVIAKIDDSYVGWLARPRPLRVLREVVLGDFHLFRSATTFYRLCADRNSKLDDVGNLGARLYSELLAPLVGQPTGSDHLWIDLDPTLANVPLAALRTGNGKWLGQEALITVLPAWWSITPGASLADPSVAPSSRFLVMNGFAGSAQHGPRVDYSEAAEIAHIFPQSMVLDAAKFDPQSLTRSLVSADIFHFSGHADATAGSHLILNDDSLAASAEGTLGPESFASLELTRCQVAVLAACNTSAIDPHEMEVSPNLRTALLIAGARSVIASSWDVDDHSTQALMLVFYRHLVSGASVTASIQSAQEAVQSHAYWQHPWFWASFQTYTR